MNTKKLQHKIFFNLILIKLLFIFSGSFIFSDQPTGLSLTIDPSARVAGIGNAYVAIAEGVSGIYYNPAGILVNPRAEVAFFHTRLNDTNTSESIYNINTIGFLNPFKNNKFGYGIVIRAFDIPEIQGYNDLGAKTSIISQQDRAISLTGSIRISPTLLFGATLKSVSLNIYGSSLEEKGTYSSDTITFDSGILYESVSKRFSFGFAVSNIGGSVKYRTLQESLPTGLRLGIAYRALEKRNLLLATDFVGIVSLDNSAMLNFGAEWNYHQQLFLRTGFSAKPAGVSSFNLGFGVWFNNFEIDYSVSPTGEFSIFHRVDLAYKFGKKPIEPEILSEEKVKKVKYEEKPVNPLPVGEKINLAVADFVGKNVSQADASIVSDFLRTELVNVGIFNVMERANMDKILAEAAFQQTGCTTSECAVQIGNLLNVKEMVVGSLSKLMDTYYITVSVVDVETGKIISSFDQEATSAKELRLACKILAQKIAKK
jgi:hypothetical protein